MRSFHCSSCRARVYFENISCLKCGHSLAFDVDSMRMVALAADAEDTGLYRRIGITDGIAMRICANASFGVCNWVRPAADASDKCRACDLNRTIPNLAEFGSLQAWGDLERAKKRLVYSLLRAGLPIDGGQSREGPLTFDFVRHATTGHLDGVVTVNVLEADAVERERQRQIFGEPYRSLLGHLRHESGHYYWHLLIEATPLLEGFRELFGDERQDYRSALDTHHAHGAPSDWAARHVSAYASCHPFEDWAETWAHYLHMVDAVDTAEAVGMEPRAAGIMSGSVWPFAIYDLYRDETFAAVMDRWVPLVLAMNTLSRSLGHTDFYPFVIPAAAYAKLEFVHRAIRRITQPSQQPAANIPMAPLVR